MKLFKPKFSSYRSPSGKKCSQQAATTVSEDGSRSHKVGYKRHQGQSKKYHGRYTNSLGQRKRIVLGYDKQVSEQMLRRKIDDEESVISGISRLNKEQRSLPITKHLENFRDALLKGGCTPGLARLTHDRLKKILAGGGCTCVDNLSSEKIKVWLLNKRTTSDQKPQTLPNGPLRPHEVAQYFGISREAVRDYVQKLELKAIGRGKARRIPVETIEAISNWRQTKRGISNQTYNHEITALNSFGKFLITTGAASTNPFRFPKLPVQEYEQRHKRRELSETELNRLMKATFESQRTFRSLARIFHRPPVKVTSRDNHTSITSV